MHRCRCGGSFATLLRLNAHYAWADALPTCAARLAHGALEQQQQQFWVQP